MSLMMINQRDSIYAFLAVFVVFKVFVNIFRYLMAQFDLARLDQSSFLPFSVVLAFLKWTPSLWCLTCIIEVPIMAPYYYLWEYLKCVSQKKIARVSAADKGRGMLAVLLMYIHNNITTAHWAYTKN